MWGLLLLVALPSLFVGGCCVLCVVVRWSLRAACCLFV